MPWNFPPLSTLRAFEATVRRGTMTAAAEEMNISQVAVSKQVSQLERHLHTVLFERGGRRLRLTSDGEMLFGTVSRIFQELQNTLEDIDGDTAGTVLNICGYSNFTMRWLIPRLAGFHDRYPLIDLRLTTSLEDVDFERSNFDAAIRSGPGEWKHLRMVELAPIELTPVCRPDIAEQLRETGPEGLADFTLLHSVARPQYWAAWLRHAKVNTIDPSSGFTFDNGSLAYEAASNGLGVSIAQKVLVLDDVRAGRLALPFEQSLSIEESYWLVWPLGRSSRKLNTFRDWLKNEVAAALPSHS